jgi:hypothetical protein
MMEAPVVSPATNPLAALTVATEVLELVHDPPAVASASAVDVALHTDVVPVIAAGKPVTVILYVAALAPQLLVIA